MVYFLFLEYMMLAEKLK